MYTILEVQKRGSSFDPVTYTGKCFGPFKSVRLAEKWLAIVEPKLKMLDHVNNTTMIQRMATPTEEFWK